MKEPYQFIMAAISWLGKQNKKSKKNSMEDQIESFVWPISYSVFHWSTYHVEQCIASKKSFLERHLTFALKWTKLIASVGEWFLIGKSFKWGKYLKFWKNVFFVQINLIYLYVSSKMMLSNCLRLYPSKNSCSDLNPIDTVHYPWYFHRPYRRRKDSFLVFQKPQDIIAPYI